MNQKTMNKEIETVNADKEELILTDEELEKKVVGGDGLGGSGAVNLESSEVVVKGSSQGNLVGSYYDLDTGATYIP